MLIPRFTIRWLLALTSASALLALVLSLAVGGRIWALAMAATLGSLAVTTLISGAIFCLAWGMALLLRSLQGRRVAASPFATHTPPPQLLEQEVPDS